MNKIPTDIYYNIFTELSFGDIIGLCNSNKRFKNFCLQNLVVFHGGRLKLPLIFV